MKMKAAEYNALIPLSEMAKLLGYVMNRSKGSEKARWLCFEKFVNGKKDHSIIINKHRNTFFCQQTGEHGTLWDFVKERVQDFPSWKPYTGKTVDKAWMETMMVLDDYLGPGKTKGISPSLPETQPLRIFSLKDYDVFFPSPNQASRQQFLLVKRGLNEKTIRQFLAIKAIAHVKDKTLEFAYSNYGFPMRIPGNEEIVNFELRNFNRKKGLSFKGFCPGGNKSDALWIASLVPTSEVKDVYVFESAIDAMSFYEVPNHTNEAAYVSCGGYMTYGGISKLGVLFPNAQFHSCCDNDTAGRLYDVMLAYYLQGIHVQAYEMETETEPGKREKRVQITLPDQETESFPAEKFSSGSFLASHHQNNVIIRHCASQFKDWNEQLLFSKNKHKDTPNEQQL